MSKKIIAIVGMAGSGKTETASFFKKKGIPILRFGEITDKGVLERGLSLNEKNERQYREQLRRELGMAAYAIKSKPYIEQMLKKSDLIVLDGLYSWEEYIYLKKYFPQVILLCIYAQPKVRYERLMKRKIRRRSLEEAKSKDIAELEKLNKGGPIAIADYLIINDTKLSDLEKKLETFLSSI